MARALSNRSSITVRRTVIIINNLCKMVKNTKDAADFLPTLLPGLDQLVEHAAFPEIRSLSQAAKDTLIKVGGGAVADPMVISVENLSVSNDEYDQVKEYMKHLLTDKGTLLGDPHFHVAFDFAVLLISVLVKNRIFYKKEWDTVLHVLDLPQIIDPLHKHFVELDRAKHPEDCGDDAEELDEGEELCDCDFSLAYGGMLLLNHTRLRLLRGRRYALLGNH